MQNSLLSRDSASQQRSSQVNSNTQNVKKKSGENRHWRPSPSSDHDRYMPFSQGRRSTQKKAEDYSILTCAAEGKPKGVKTLHNCENGYPKVKVRDKRGLHEAKIEKQDGKAQVRKEKCEAEDTQLTEWVDSTCETSKDLSWQDTFDGKSTFRAKKVNRVNKKNYQFKKSKEIEVHYEKIEKRKDIAFLISEGLSQYYEDRGRS